MLKNSVVDEVADGQQIIETICELEDAEFLLAHAKRFYPEAVPYMLKGLSPDDETNRELSHMSARKRRKA